MTLPESVLTAADDVIDIIKGSQARLEAEQAAYLAETDRAQRRLNERRERRLRELLAAIERELVVIETAAETFATTVLPVVYEAGGASTGFRFRFDQFNRAALERLQDDTMDRILQATSYMREDTKRWVRDTTRRVIVEGQAEGLTARQMARRFANLSPKAATLAGVPQPITAIVYSNGAVWTVDNYADMLMRSQSGITYNHGAVNTAYGYGVTRFEIRDGAGCGLTSHDDGTEADGMIVDAETALAYPLSHPGCRRSISGRPDLDGTPLPAMPERAGPPIQLPVPTRRVAARQARQPRTARNPRTARV